MSPPVNSLPLSLQLADTKDSRCLKNYKKNLKRWDAHEKKVNKYFMDKILD